MKVLFTVLVLGFIESAMAQSHGYGFAGVTMSEKSLQSALRYGLGGVIAIVSRVTIGGEAGGFHKNGAGALASANLGVHLRQRVENGFDPFATSGITGVYIGMRPDCMQTSAVVSTTGFARVPPSGWNFEAILLA
jgi:hypothetical protein